MTAQRIAVVGAGIAGLTLARRLADARADPMLFDKARRPGGRVSTQRTHELAFDHGALARDLAVDLDVASEQQIARVERSSGRWRLITDAGRIFDGFNAVVIATPAPQAVPLLAGLPQLAARVGAVEMQSCHAAMVAFAEPFGVDFGGAFVADSPLSWVARNGTKPGRPDGECWVLQTTPEWSAEHLDVASDAITAALLEALSAALGRALPPPTHRASHQWRFARSELALGHPFLWDPDARLGVCGDWAFGGRIESAFSSGAQLATSMLG
jgi:hypothetical protein